METIQPQLPQRRSPIEYGERVETARHRLPRIRFRGDDGKELSCPHPEIVSRPAGLVFQEEDPVDVVLFDEAESVTVPFGTYLEALGVPYARYLQAVKREQGADIPRDQRKILKELHQSVIDYRTERAMALAQDYEKQEPGKIQKQELTTREDGQFFVHLFNDLQIDGLRAESSRRREDFLDGIDEYLVFDEKALSGNDDADVDHDRHELYVGVQRSFDDKVADVRSDHWRAVPERSNLLAIPRVGLHENFSDYALDERGKGEGYWQKLLNLRTEEADRKGKRPKDVHLPAVYRVLGETKEQGKEEWMRRVIAVLSTIQNELEGYSADKHATPDQRARLDRYLSVVDAALRQVKGDAQ